MKIKYRGHQKRKEEARDLWIRIATDFNSGMTPKEIAERYTNKNTGKPYHVNHIYYILRQIDSNPIN